MDGICSLVQSSWIVSTTKQLEEEIEKLILRGGLRNRDQTLTLSRLMIRAEESDSRLSLLRVLQQTKEQACLRLFLDYHGLSLIWSWMADLGVGDDSIELKTQILQTLQILPISNKTILMDSRVMGVVQRWAELIAEAQQREKDRDSETADSEPASQAVTPLHPYGNDTDKEDIVIPVPQIVAVKLLESVTEDRNGIEDAAVRCAVQAILAQIELEEQRRTYVADNETEKVQNENVTVKLELSLLTDEEDSSVAVMKEILERIEQSEITSSSVLQASNCNAEIQLGEEINSENVCLIPLPPETTSTRDGKKRKLPLLPLPVELVKAEVKRELCTPADNATTPNGVIEEHPVASLAAKLLELWSSLKEAYRIPKREQNQNRREHEREADRRAEEDDDWEPDFLEFYGEKELGSSERSRHRRSRESDRWDRDWDYDRYDDHDRHDRKRSRDSPDRDYRHSRNSEKNDRKRKKHIKTNLFPSSSSYSSSSSSYSSSGRPPLLPTPLTKEERRQQFEMSVQREEQEEEMRKQHEEYVRQQHEAMIGTIDPTTGAVYYDPNYPPTSVPPPTAYYDPTTGAYIQAAIPLPGPVIHPPGTAIGQPYNPGVVQFEQAVVAPFDPTQHVAFDPAAIPPQQFDATQVTFDPASVAVPQFDPNQVPFDHTGATVTQFDSVQVPFDPANGAPPTFDPNEAQTFDPGPAATFDVAAGSATSFEQTTAAFDPSAQQFDPAAQQFDPAAQQFDPAAQQFDPAGQQFDPAASGTLTYDPTTVATYDPAQPSPTSVTYPPPNVVYTQPPRFLPPLTQAPPPTTAHYVAPNATPPVYYPPPNLVSSSPIPTNSAIIHLPPPDQAAWPQPHLVTVVEEMPPPEPVKQKPVKLPPNWKTAKDGEGRTYYYHAVTRQTQWEPPAWDPSGDNDMDLGTPTYDEPKVKKSKKKAMTAAADTSSELAKRIKELFRTRMSQFIVQCLNPYRKPDCKIGRIISTEDFKHLARKLTHFVMAKELKHCRNIEDLECNENVKHKAKDFVKKYMAKFGTVYRKAASPKDEKDDKDD